MNSDSPAGVPARTRFIVVLAFGLVAGHAVLLRTPYFGTPRDLMQFWYAARIVLDGGDPYAAIGPGRSFAYSWPLVYPLPSSVLLLPLAGLTPAWACAIFAGLGSACFAWALMEHGYASLLAFGSVCLWQAIFVVQWSPFLAASLVIVPLGFMLVAKPTVGLAYFVARPSWWAVGGAIILTSLAFALDPSWVSQWRAALARAVLQAKHGFPYHAPVVMPGGILILTALARWRRPEARLLVGLACIPHTTLPYELVPLFLIPRGWLQSGALVALSHLMWGIVTRDFPHPDFYYTVIEYTKASVPCLYLPCTLMILRRANESEVSAALQRHVVEGTSWLRRRVLPR